MAVRKKHRGRRRGGRFGFLYVALSFLLIVAALFAGSVVFFRANSIIVEGNEQYTADEIITAAQVELNENLFRINRPRTYQRIFDALPYIRDVNIRRAFPDKLIITVSETKAAAFLTADDSYFLLDARGKFLEEVPSPPSSLPQITGITPLSPAVGSWLEVEPASQHRLDGLTGLLTALETQGTLQYLAYADLSSASDLIFGYTDRFTVQMPLTCDHPYKISALNYVLSQLESNETGLIDLTRNNETHFIPQ